MRCSKVVIVQLLAVVAFFAFLNFYVTNTSAEENQSSERKKFAPLDTDMLPTEVVSHKETVSTESAYKHSSLPDLNDTQQLIKFDKLNQKQLLKLLVEEKERERLEKLKVKKQKEQDEAMSVEVRIKERMERVKEVCGRLNYPNSEQYNMYHFKKYGEHGISWCPTFKASSSTWRDFFIDNVLGPRANYRGNHYHLGVLGNQILTRNTKRGSSSKRRRTFMAESEESVRFTVVRHPISRLISHLRKAQNYPYEVKAQRGDWVEESILESRTDPAWDSATRDRYRREWFDYIREIGSTGDHTPASDDNPYLHPPYPVFPELVSFVMKHRPLRDDKGKNGHWRPTIEWCDICQNDLDIIIQLEEEPEELLYLLDKLGMLQYKDNFLSKHNSSSNKSASKDEIIEYVKQLNTEQINYLNKMYAADFEMFGYDPIAV